MFDRERERGVTDKGGRNAACRHEKVALDEVFVEALFNGGGSGWHLQVEVSSIGQRHEGDLSARNLSQCVKDGVKEGKQNIKDRR